jgi:uncharacterized protein DUF1508
MMSARVEIFAGQGRILPGWYVRIVAANGQTVVVSERYSTKWNAKRAAKVAAAKWDGVEVVDTTAKPYRRFG